MEIIKSEEIKLTSEKWDILNKAVKLLNEIYQDAEDHEIYSPAEQARDSIVDLLENYC